MPHRVAAAAVSYVFEGLIFGFLAVYHGTITIFSEADWGKITGPHGVAFISLLAVVVLWNQGRAAAKAREKQHAETLALQERNAERLCELTAESIKAQAKAVSTMAELRKETANLGHEVRTLGESIGKKPCHAVSIIEMVKSRRFFESPHITPDA